MLFIKTGQKNLVFEFKIKGRFNNKKIFSVIDEIKFVFKSLISFIFFEVVIILILLKKCLFNKSIVF